MRYIYLSDIAVRGATRCWRVSQLMTWRRMWVEQRLWSVDTRRIRRRLILVLRTSQGSRREERLWSLTRTSWHLRFETSCMVVLLSCQMLSFNCCYDSAMIMIVEVHKLGSFVRYKLAVEQMCIVQNVDDEPTESDAWRLSSGTKITQKLGYRKMFWVGQNSIWKWLLRRRVLEMVFQTMRIKTRANTRIRQHMVIVWNGISHFLQCCCSFENDNRSCSVSRKYNDS